MRELAVAELSDSINTVFNDIEALAMRCRFSDCRHDTEPGCAVRNALESGELDSRRLSNYRKLLRENDLATMTLAEQRSRGRNFAKMVKTVKAIKQGRNDT